jgi:DNA invertase Pin-like site-specific DNA recombinase
MIVGYARVSTKDQHLELQLDALKQAQCERVFSDKASGSKTERPELNKCLKFLQREDVLHVWKLDRLGRNLRHLVNIVHDLNDRGIGFKVLTGQGAAIDTTTAPGKLVFGIFAALAEFERELIRERVNAGIAAAKAKGVRFGPPTKITPELLAQAQHAVAQGRSVRHVATDLGIGKSALYKAL